METITDKHHGCGVMTVELMNTVTVNTVNTEIAQADVDVNNASVLRSIFEAISPESCPQYANFHMHTMHSDGNLTPEVLIQQAIQIGLHDLAITDHHSVAGYRHAKQYLEQEISCRQVNDGSAMPRLWVGAEVNAQLLDLDVHILCYGFDPDADVMQPYLQGEAVTGDRYTAASVIAAIHNAGGLAVLAHPNRYRRSPTDLIPEASRLGIDGVESYYAYDNPSPWRPSPKQTALVYQLGEEHGLFHTCGTDTHGLSLLTRL